MVFDDIHWGEPTFLDLVEHLADWSRGAPILLLCMARPELLDVRPGWGGGKLNATSVLLEPLSADECTQLVANLVGEAELAEEVEARIASAAEGNPLFVEEMLSMLIDDGLLVREDGRWTAAGDLTTVPVPPTIHALLAARLDHGQFLPFFQFQAASALMLIGDWDSAEAALQRGYEPLRMLGRISHFAAHAVSLAHIRYRQGRYDEAGELLDEADRASHPNDVWDRIHSHIERARLLGWRGDLVSAERVLARETVELAASSDFLPSHADALMNLAETIRLAGKDREADDALQGAIRLHEQKGNLLAAAAARARLEDGRGRA